jgi:hypothetical protein
MVDHDDKQPRARLSQKEKLEKRLSQNAITAERADKIKSAYAIIRGASTPSYHNLYACHACTRESQYILKP